MASEFDCDGHTVNDIVFAYGEPMSAADDDRIGEGTAHGLVEFLMVPLGP